MCTCIMGDTSAPPPVIAETHSTSMNACLRDADAESMSPPTCEIRFLRQGNVQMHRRCISDKSQRRRIQGWTN